MHVYFVDCNLRILETLTHIYLTSYNVIMSGRGSSHTGRGRGRGTLSVGLTRRHMTLIGVPKCSASTVVSWVTANGFVTSFSALSVKDSVILRRIATI